MTFPGGGRTTLIIDHINATMADTVSEVWAAKQAALQMAALNTAVKDAALTAMAAALDAQRTEILAANAVDVAAAEGKLPAEMIKRLKISDGKIDDMVAGLQDLLRIPDPVGQTISAMELDTGLMLYQVRCPIGMIGVIFESRPDVVPQIMSLCLKSGNSVAFKGGSEAACSNRALFTILRDAAAGAGVPAAAFVLMETRDDINKILSLDEYIDLLIPRGSYQFVRYIHEHTRIPVLGHAAGVCHVYVDGAADMDLALNIVLDAKTQYPAVCNAAECLLVDREIAPVFLPRMGALFAEKGVEMRVSPEAKPFLAGLPVKDAASDEWTKEYDDLIIRIGIVDGVDAAIDFINSHGSHHTDAIITADESRQRNFARRVDSADVLINASTRFADGYRFGKGAEVGIATGRIHARGPMGMEGLMIYKYVLVGHGQVVRDYAGPHAKPFKHQPSNDRYVM
ncbi:MAG: glutamate-5-semialdehyde dehydrogenase [Methanomethylophilus sp.]